MRELCAFHEFLCRLRLANIMKIIAFMCLISLVFFELPIFAQTVSSVSFVTIDQGQDSGVTTARNVAIYKRKDWKTFWKEHAGDSTPPSINFRKKMVVAVILGTRSNGCYSVNIDNVENETGQQLIVYYTETMPGETCACTQAITNPYHIVKTKKSKLDVVFQGNTATLTCE